MNSAPRLRLRSPPSRLSAFRRPLVRQSRISTVSRRRSTRLSAGSDRARTAPSNGPVRILTRSGATATRWWRSSTMRGCRLHATSRPPLLDRVEIRQIGQKDEGKLIELALSLPKKMTLSEADGTETKITLRMQEQNAVVEAQSGRGRETAVTIASARIDQPKTGAWVSVGPLSMASKLVAEPNGGWSGPVEFEVEGDRVLSPAGARRRRDRSDRVQRQERRPKAGRTRQAARRDRPLQADDSRSPEARGAASWRPCSTIAAPFSTIRGEFALDGLTVRSVTGETLVSLAKAEAPRS